MNGLSQRVKYILIGILFVFVLGCVAHFFYDWSGKNYFVGLFFPTSESTWEHMKLVFIPMLIYSVIMNHKMVKEYKAYTLISLSGVLVGTWLVPILCFSYRGIIGNGIMWLDIATFFLSVILAFLLENHMFCYIGDKEYPNVTTIMLVLNGVQLLCFVWFSFRPLPIGIFQTLPQ